MNSSRSSDEKKAEEKISLKQSEQRLLKKTFYLNDGYSFDCMTSLRDGNLAVASAKNGSIRIVDPNTGNIIRRLPQEIAYTINLDDHGYASDTVYHSVDCMTSLLDRTLAVASAKDGYIRVVDPGTGNIIRRLTDRVTSDSPPVDCMTTLLDGNLAVASAKNGSIRIVDSNTGNIIRRLPQEISYTIAPDEYGNGGATYYHSIDCMTTLSDGRLAVASTESGDVRIIDPDTGNVIRRFPKDISHTSDPDEYGNGGATYYHFANCIANTSNGNLVVASTRRGYIRTFQLQNDYIEVSKAARIISQAYRDQNTLFFKLPKAICLKIATTLGNIQDEKNTLKIAEAHFGNPVMKK